MHLLNASDTVAAAEKLFQALGFRVDIEEVSHPQGRVLVFHIPSRPRGTAYHLDGKYLMRAGEALVPMSEDQLRRIFAEGEPDLLEEPTRNGLDAQAVIELLDTQAYFDLLKLPYPTNREAVIDRLVRERLIDVDADRFSIRRLGADGPANRRRSRLFRFPRQPILLLFCLWRAQTSNRLFRPCHPP